MRNYDPKGILLIVVFCLATLGLFLVGVLAQAQTRANASWPLATPAAPLTVRGTVAEVVHHACSPAAVQLGKGNLHSPYCATTDIVLRTKNRFVNVRLGPTKFIRDNRFLFVDGDRLLVLGFPAADHGRTTVVSEEVIKSKSLLTLRDAHGRPLWSKKAQSETAPEPSILPMNKPFEGADALRILSRNTGKMLAIHLRF